MLHCEGVVLAALKETVVRPLLKKSALDHLDLNSNWPVTRKITTLFREGGGKDFGGAPAGILGGHNLFRSILIWI